MVDRWRKSAEERAEIRRKGDEERAVAGERDIRRKEVDGETDGRAVGRGAVGKWMG